MLYCNVTEIRSEMKGDAMRRRWAESSVMVGAALVATASALAQTPPPPQSPAVDPSLGVTVTATRLDEARSSIQPSLGASKYEFTPGVIETVPQGDKAPLNQVLL